MDWKLFTEHWCIFLSGLLSERQAGQQTAEGENGPWRLPLPFVLLVRSERSVMAWNRAEGDLRRCESKVRMALGASTAGPLWERGPPPPSFPPVNLCTSSKAHPSPAPLSSRTQDNALYSLITLSNWRALRSRALGIIKTNQHESFFLPSAAAPTGGREQGGKTVFGGGFKRKKGEIETSE